jgi:hypothetical protein
VILSHFGLVVSLPGPDSGIIVIFVRLDNPQVN